MRVLHKKSPYSPARYSISISSGSEEVSLGSVNESIAHPRDVLRPANFSGLCRDRWPITIRLAIVAKPVRSQPNGRLAEAAELLRVKLLDRIIIGAPAQGRSRLLPFQKGIGVL